MKWNVSTYHLSQVRQNRQYAYLTSKDQPVKPPNMADDLV